MLPIMQSCCRGKLLHSVAQVILYNYLHIALWESYSGKWKYVYLSIIRECMYVVHLPDLTAIFTKCKDLNENQIMLTSDSQWHVQLYFNLKAREKKGRWQYKVMGGGMWLTSTNQPNYQQEVWLLR